MLDPGSEQWRGSGIRTMLWRMPGWRSMSCAFESFDSIRYWDPVLGSHWDPILSHRTGCCALECSMESDRNLIDPGQIPCALAVYTCGLDPGVVTGRHLGSDRDALAAVPLQALHPGAERHMCSCQAFPYLGQSAVTLIMPLTTSLHPSSPLVTSLYPSSPLTTSLYPSSPLATSLHT